MLACRRHLRDLKQQRKLKLHFDHAAAQHTIEFIENFLVLAEGDHADRPFILRPWQKFIVGCLFGWKLADGSRRFRRAYIEIGKGNGKTPLAAACAIFCLVADGEQAAECYTAAVTEKQAGVAFRDANIMAQKSPELSGLLDIGEHNIAYHTTFSFLRPISSEHRGLDGKRVHFCIVDEVHEHPHPLVVNKMVAGLKGRRQPMIMEITNSGFDKTTVCGEHHDYGVEILEETKRNESWFVYICGLDPCARHAKEGDREPKEGCKKCDQWTDEKVWIKANPNLGHSVPLRYLRDQVRNALAIPSEQSMVKRLNFCIWTQQAARWLPLDGWHKGDKPIDFAKLKERQCFVGLDMGVTNDFAAVVLLFPPPEIPMIQETEAAEVDESGKPLTVSRIDVKQLQEPYIILPFFWLPHDRVVEMVRSDRVPYELWEKTGLIYTNQGNVIDDGFIKQKLLALNDLYSFRCLGYDKAFAGTFATQLLNDHRLPVVEVGQSNAELSHPSREFERLVTAGKVQHGGNPVLTWMASNATVKEDSRRRIHVQKPTRDKKIDGIIAAINALKVCIVNPDLRSVYETRGVLAG